MAPGRRTGLAGIACLSLLAALPAAAHAEVTAPYSQAGSEAVAPGVVARWGNAASDLGPEIVKIAEIDPSRDGIRFRTSLPHDLVNGRETTTSQALRYSGEEHLVVAAINGPVFASYPGTHYSARGLNVQDGELTSANPRTVGMLTAFAVDDAGRARIGTPTLTVTVTLPDGQVGSVDRVNSGRMPGETVLFTPRFDSHTWTGADGDEYVIDGAALPLSVSGTWVGTVSAVRPALGDAPIGPGQLVLSTSGEKAALYAGLSVGDTLTMDIGIDHGWAGTVQAIGAKQIIVRDGVVDIRPYDLDDVAIAHPRSAIGVTADGRVLMVAVEGRSLASAGLRLEELAQLMISLGAVDALNMDGGGSTTLAVRQPGDFEVSVVNTLSGGGTTPVGTERTVSNTLQVVSSFPTGPLSDLVVGPPTTTLAVGQSQQFTVRGHDSHYNGVAPGPVAWQVSGGAAIDTNGLLVGQALGSYTVTARSDGHEASAALSVIVPPPPTVPAGLTATPAAGRAVNLAWEASTAPIPGTITYRLVRDGKAIGTQQASLTFTDHPKAGSHSYQVRAINAVGTRSALSPPIVAVAYDSVPPPTVPTSVTVTTAPAGAVNVAWGASSAAVPGQVTYRVFRDGKAVGAQTSSLTYTDQPTIGTHSYQVRAIDATGVRSALSTAISVTTSP